MVKTAEIHLKAAGCLQSMIPKILYGFFACLVGSCSKTHDFDTLDHGPVIFKPPQQSLSLHVPQRKPQARAGCIWAPQATSSFPFPPHLSVTPCRDFLREGEAPAA